jgi:hypothetical protein
VHSTQLINLFQKIGPEKLAEAEGVKFAPFVVHVNQLKDAV